MHEGSILLCGPGDGDANSLGGVGVVIGVAGGANSLCWVGVVIVMSLMLSMDV